MKIKFILLLVILFLTGCTKQLVVSGHQGKPFAVQKNYTLTELNKGQNVFIKRRVPIRVSGYIKYQDSVLGQWAFVDMIDGTIFTDLTQTSPNISLPKQKTAKEIALEGYLVADDTVLNGFALQAYGYELVSRNGN